MINWRLRNDNYETGIDREIRDFLKHFIKRYCFLHELNEFMISKL